MWRAQAEEARNAKQRERKRAKRQKQRARRKEEGAALPPNATVLPTSEHKGLPEVATLRVQPSGGGGAFAPHQWARTAANAPVRAVEPGVLAGLRAGGAVLSPRASAPGRQAGAAKRPATAPRNDKPVKQ